MKLLDKTGLTLWHAFNHQYLRFTTNMFITFYCTNITHFELNGIKINKTHCQSTAVQAYFVWQAILHSAKVPMLWRGSAPMTCWFGTCSKFPVVLRGWVANKQHVHCYIIARVWSGELLISLFSFVAITIESQLLVLTSLVPFLCYTFIQMPWI